MARRCRQDTATTSSLLLLWWRLHRERRMARHRPVEAVLVEVSFALPEKVPRSASKPRQQRHSKVVAMRPWATRRSSRLPVLGALTAAAARSRPSALACASAWIV